MTKIPRDIPGDRLIRAPGRIGWYTDHQVGSHVTLRNAHRLGVKLVIPVHAGKPLKPRLMNRILKEVGLSVEELLQLL